MIVTILKRTTAILLGLVAGILVVTPVYADDIEIYTSAGTSTTPATQANVMLILDTSGSMKNPVQTRATYDPAHDYSGGLGCFSNNRLYSLPYGSSFAFIHCDPAISPYYGDVRSLSQVSLGSFVCNKAANINTTGYFTGQLSQYRGRAWRNNMVNAYSNPQAGNFVECEVDKGIHGKSTGSTKVWASSSNGPWSYNQNDEIRWDSNDSFYDTLYSGRYLNYLINAPITSTTAKSRMQIMKDVINQLLANTAGINVGLMRFSKNGEGGMVSVPVADVGTNLSTLKSEINKMKPKGTTPLAETFYEAAMYFSGGPVDYGRSSKPFKSVRSSHRRGKYISPIANECQKNYAVILTDGDPTNDALSGNRLGRLNINQCLGNCLDEIARSIGTNDQNTVVNGKQVVSTFTIGFAIDNQLLKDTANESYRATKKGKRFLADDTTSLMDTLNQVFASVLKTNATFSSPAVSVNAFNRATHLDDLYFTLFQPANSPHWAGNLKKYKLSSVIDVLDRDQDGDVNERIPVILDANGVEAISGGFFSNTSRSYWTDITYDGAQADAGGAANEFKTGRHVYTYSGNYTASNGLLVPSLNRDLSVAANRVSKTNPAITTAMLGIINATQKVSGIPRIETLLDWAAGIDVLDENADGNVTDMRQSMGDPLHSQPALVMYGGTASSPDLVAYTATNDGYLHAINTRDGTEIFSFIPQELLPNLDTIMENRSGRITYGLDGSVKAWVDDKNSDGVINGNDHVYLYVSMRRGGRNVYSLDVTDRKHPVLRWVIKGGSGNYSELAQTWSDINVKKIKDGNTEKVVLIFGGGYDTNQDSVTVRTPDRVGRAVYIVDATTGKLMWSASPGGDLQLASMKYSIPARIKPLDMDGDGLTDRLYAADMGGQIFRFDIDNHNGSSLVNSIQGGRIADLAGSADIDARRFYYPPDVALIAERGKPAYLALGIASGYRAHPLDTKIQDRIYLLKDMDVYNTPNYSTLAPLTESKLYDATLNLVAGDGNQSQNNTAQAALDSMNGWYIKLDDESGTNTWVGEKGLAETLFMEGNLIVTTYIPDSSRASSRCVINSAGKGRIFYLDVLDGSASFPSSLDIRRDRNKWLSASGIPASPSVVISDGGVPTVCVGTECEPADLSLGVRRTFWYEKEQ